MKRILILPNIVTAFGLSCGLFLIFKLALTPVQEIDFFFLIRACTILLLAALADLLDGLIARIIKAESEFGGFFDSLADAISFGVAPSVMVLKSIEIASGTDLAFFLLAASMIFSVCGVLRLVRFNVQSFEKKEELTWYKNGKKNFTGLPIPAAAAAIVSLNLFLSSEQVNTFSETIKAWILIAAFFLIGYLMISKLKFISFKALQIRVRSFSIVLATVVFTVILFYGVFHNFSIIFLFLSWLYIFLSLLFSAVRFFSGKTSKTLEDFEPSIDPFEEESNIINFPKEEENFDDDT